MVLEACVLCIDNSDFMPERRLCASRMEAQQDAVNLLSGTKCQSNPENSVGVLSMAGAGVTLHVALTGDVGKILSLSHGIAIGGEVNITAGIQVAQLALKHRQNKNQRQRIIVFVGSLIADAEAALVKLGKKLKKNSVAMDIVNFGEVRAAAAPPRRASRRRSRPSTPARPPAPPRAPPTPHRRRRRTRRSSRRSSTPSTPTTTRTSSPCRRAPRPLRHPAHVADRAERGRRRRRRRRRGGGGGGGGGEFQEFAGVDPTLDPEFAWALRVDGGGRARQEAEAKKRAEEGGDGEASATGESAPAAAADAPMGEAAAADEGELDEAALLEQAIAMSMPPPPPPTSSPPPRRRRRDARRPRRRPRAGAREKRRARRADQGARARRRRDGRRGGRRRGRRDAARARHVDVPGACRRPAPAAAAGAAGASAAGGADNLAAVFQDQAFVQGILSSLPGVDPNDPAIQSVLKNLEKKDEGGEKKDDKK